MSTNVSRPALLPPSGWRGLARLAAEGLAAGLVVSIALMLAVFIVATQAEAAPPGAFAAAVKAADAHGGALKLAARDGEPEVLAPLVATEVSIDVAGIVARTTVRQRFINPTAVWREGVYLFPLPDKAAVDHLRVETGSRVIEGMIRERGEAKRVYEQAKSQGKQAGLVDQQRPNLFTTRVAQLPPGAEVIVTIDYQETARYDGGTFRLRFPMAVTPRYVPSAHLAEAALDADADGTMSDAAGVVAPFALPGDGQVAPVIVQATIDAGFALERIESTTHAIRDETLPDGRTRVRLAEGVVPADRDLELAWTPKVGSEPGAAVFTEEVGGRHHVLVMVLPPSVPAAESPLPREATFVVDTSGSMAGTSILQAKEAMQFALSRLKPGDRFNVIEFNSVTWPLWPAPMPVDPATLEHARRFVAGFRADGGTEMKPALAAAFAPPPAPGFARQVFFLTDGAVGNEQELMKLVRERAGDRRLYTIAIGPAPNAWFIRKAAQFGRGTSTFIGDVNDVRERMTALFAKLERPALTDLAITWPVGADVHPAKLPDLYDGEPIVATAAFKGDMTTLSIVGRHGKRAWGKMMPLGRAADAEGIGALWARDRIAALSDAMIEGAPEAEVKPLIIATALEHHLVSKYTSLVAVDVTPIAPAGTTPERTDIPGLLPAGLDPAGFVGGLPQTATPWPLLALLGAALLALAAWLRPRRRAGGLPPEARFARLPPGGCALGAARRARGPVPADALETRADLARQVC